MQNQFTSFSLAHHTLKRRKNLLTMFKSFWYERNIEISTKYLLTLYWVILNVSKNNKFIYLGEKEMR